MDQNRLDKIINIIREQRIDVSKIPAPTGGGGGTNALTAQAKVRTWGASLKSLIGGDYAAAKKEYNDPQRYWSDDEYKNRPTFAQHRRAEADKVLANKKPLPQQKSYKNQFGESMDAGAAGFTGAADPKGPTAGFDPVMGKKPRKRYIYQKGLRKNWKTDG